MTAPRPGPAPQASPAHGSTVYLSRAAWEQLDAAQAIVDRHAASAARGVCQICQLPDPCPTRATAAARIGRYGVLPRRRPGPGAGRLDEPDPGASTREFTWFNRGLVGAR